MKEIIQILLFGAISAGFLAIGIGRWRTRYSCKEAIRGKCTSVHVSSNVGVTRIQAAFEYNYAGKLRRALAVDDLSSKQKAGFIPEQEYVIYVNPKKPEEIRCTKAVHKIEDICLVLFGGFMTSGAVILLMSALINCFL